MTDDQQEWLRVRDHLRTQRAQLTEVALRRYRDLPTVAGTALLSRRGWLPVEPFDLRSVELTWDAAPPTWPPTLPG